MPSRRINSVKKRRKRLRLYLNQGSYCPLCGGQMTWVGEDTSIPGTHHDDEYATIDHILPLSKGGGWANDNLRLVHRRCNLARGCGEYEERIAA